MLLEVSLQSLGFLGCSEGEPGGGYICPKLVARVSEILYPMGTVNYEQLNGRLSTLWLQVVSMVMSTCYKLQERSAVLLVHGMNENERK